MYLSYLLGSSQSLMTFRWDISFYKNESQRHNSNIVLLHAHDLLDQRLIEEGTFVPMFTEGDTVVAIDEII